MKKDFFLNGFTAIAIVGMALSACTDNEPDYGLGADEIYIVTGRTDMRKSIDGLCAIVEDQLHMDPSSYYL